MSNEIIVMMIGVSTLLGALGLAGLIWAIKTGQFDDHNKFIDAVRNDNEEDLRDAVAMEKKKTAYKKKKEAQKEYMPPD